MKDKDINVKVFKWLAFCVIIVILLYGILYGIPSYIKYHSPFAVDTCENSDAAVLEYLQSRNPKEVRKILKTAEFERMKVIIYDTENLGLCYAVFEQKLFGTRLKYEGMDGVTENGLNAGFHIYKNIGNMPDYYIIICGDNRDGSVDSYLMKSFSQVRRDDLESDLIIDIYRVDGLAGLKASEFRKDLQQLTPDGETFVYQYPYVN